MRFLGLIAVLAIVYVLYSKRAQPGPDSTDKAMAEFAQTAPAGSAASNSPAPASGASTSNIRRPIDTTRQVLDRVKKQNSASEF